MTKTELKNLIIECYKEIIRESTELTSIVVKASSEKRAEAAAKHLEKFNIDARVTYPAEIDPFNTTEKAGWGVFVKPKDVKKAAKELADVSKGLTFDPYSRS